MKVSPVLFMLATAFSVQGATSDRQPLAYAPVPDGTYMPPSNENSTSLLKWIHSRSDLSKLSKVLSQVAGFEQAFASDINVPYTFFAPSDTAFNNTGLFFNTFAQTPKGKWWLGNLLQHHYIPNTKLFLSNFTQKSTRVQTSSYLYLGTQVVGGRLLINKVSKVTDGDIKVSSGVVHVIDHILSPEAQLFEPDIEKTKQNFIPGSCANTDLAYC